MDYVALLRYRSSVTSADRDAAIGRRVAWEYPKGITLIAEYWPMSSNVNVVSIFTTDSAEAIMELEFEWSDAFDVDIIPAVSVDDGLRIGPEVFARLARLQG